MLDGEKFLRELPVLHGKIEMPDYNGVCTGVWDKRAIIDENTYSKHKCKNKNGRFRKC